MQDEMELFKSPDVALVLIEAAALEHVLRLRIRDLMMPLSKKLNERLFEGYGPLSSFSAKVDVAFALKVISEEAYRELTLVRKIRNELAHSFEDISFRHPDVIPLCKQLKFAKEGGSNEEIFTRSTKWIGEQLLLRTG